MVETFKPVRISEYFLKQIAAGLKKEMYESMFKYIFEVVNDKTINNSLSVLENALNSGRIYYQNGAFRSNKPFSNILASELENLGAKFQYGAYYIDIALLPAGVQSALNSVAAREAMKIAALNSVLLKLSQTAGQKTNVKAFIEKSVEQMFKKLQVDLEDSTALKQVPIIDISVEIPNLEVSEKKLEDITKYWEETDKEAEILHTKWFSKVKEAERIEDELKSAKGKDKNNLQKQLNRINTEKENDRQQLADFREAQRKNAPKINLNTDVTGLNKEYNTESEDNPSPVDDNKNFNLDDIKLDKKAQKIAWDYTYNMDYWVKNWKAREIVKMRRTVLHMVQKGERWEAIQEYLQDRWKIAKNKAVFLARNESGLASSVLKATHYQEMGCTHFKWFKSTSKEKRELHLEYAKETGNQYGIGGTNIFAFDNPPIIEQIKVGEGKDAKYLPKPNGQRGLPQQTYNCECDFIGIKNIEYYINRQKIENAKRNIFTKIKYAIQNSLQRNNNPWRYRRLGEGAQV